MFFLYHAELRAPSRCDYSSSSFPRLLLLPTGDNMSSFVFIVQSSHFWLILVSFSSSSCCYYYYCRHLFLDITFNKTKNMFIDGWLSAHTRPTWHSLVDRVCPIYCQCILLIVHLQFLVILIQSCQMKRKLKLNHQHLNWIYYW